MDWALRQVASPEVTNTTLNGSRQVISHIPGAYSIAGNASEAACMSQRGVTLAEIRNCLGTATLSDQTMDCKMKTCFWSRCKVLGQLVELLGIYCYPQAHLARMHDKIA